MKRMINRLICLCRGHKWLETAFRIHYWSWTVETHYKCARCGKIKEEFI